MGIYASLSICRKLVSYMCRKLASYKSAGKFPTKCDCWLNFSRIFCFTCNVQETSFLQKCRKFSYKMLSWYKFGYYCLYFEHVWEIFLQNAGKFPTHKCKMLHKCRKISCTYSKNLDYLVKCRKHVSYTSTSKYRCT